MTAPPVTLRSPAELLAVIPHLLGFLPHHAIVVLALRNNKIVLTQRMDLPDPDRVQETADALHGHVLREAAQAALLVAYEEAPGESLTLMEAVAERLQRSGVALRDRIVVHDRRWRSIDCDRPSCCPPKGSSLPPSSQVASAVAEFIGVGSAPLPDRQALADQLEPSPAAAEVADLLRRGQGARTTLAGTQAQRRLAETWVRILTVGQPIGPTDAAIALQSLADTGTRDGVASLLIPTGLDVTVLTEETQKLVRRVNTLRASHGSDGPDLTSGPMKARLIDLCRHATDEHATPALTLLATYSWWHGDGALARVAIDRALRCDPDYRLAQLLQLMLDEGIRPERP